MFDDLKNRLNRMISEMEHLQGKHSIELDSDNDGYSDRECPNEKCKFRFKVFEEDWINNFKDEAVYCPSCREVGHASNFWTTDHIDKIVESIQEQILNVWSLDIEPGTPLHSIPALDPFKQKIICPECKSRYSVLGSAYFCPCCGYNSVEQTLENSLSKIELKLESIDLIIKPLEDNGMLDEAQILRTTLIETSLSDIVVAFQHYTEKQYSKATNNTAPRNAFQNLERGSKEWVKSGYNSYVDLIGETKLHNLNIKFQQRHLLQHNEGIVDEKYIRNSGDNTYCIGQRIVLSRNFVLEGLELTRLLISELINSIKKN